MVGTLRLASARSAASASTPFCSSVRRKSTVKASTPFGLTGGHVDAEVWGGAAKSVAGRAKGCRATGRFESNRLCALILSRGTQELVHQAQVVCQAGLRCLQREPAQIRVVPELAGSEEVGADGQGDCGQACAAIDDDAVFQFMGASTRKWKSRPHPGIVAVRHDVTRPASLAVEALNRLAEVEQFGGGSWLAHAGRSLAGQLRVGAFCTRLACRAECPCKGPLGRFQAARPERFAGAHCPPIAGLV